MKKLLIALGCVVVLLIIAVLVVPPLIPAEAYKGQLLKRISAATGRKVQIDGKFGFTILPELGFYADKVALSNAPGATPAAMVTIDKLSLRVAPMPLLWGKVVVRSFVFEQPVVHLSVDEKGQPNWRPVGRSAHSAPAPGTQNGGARGALQFLRELTLGDVRIVDGKVTYTNARHRSRDEVDAVNATLSLPSLDKPMAVDGSLVWHKEKIALALHLAAPRALLAERPSTIDAEITTKLLRASFKGKLNAGEPITANGNLAVESPSLRELAAWAGKKLQAPGSTFGRFKLDGKVALAGATFALRSATFSLDATKGEGEVRINDGGAYPFVAAKFRFGRLDLNPYLAASSVAPQPESTPAPEHAAEVRPSPAPAPPSQGLSAAPAALPRLAQLDGAFDLTFAGVQAGTWAVGHSHASISLKAGHMTAILEPVALYGGKATARMTLGTTAATAATPITFSSNLYGVDLGSLLEAAIGAKPLDGTTNLSLQIVGHGHTWHQILPTLSGAGRIDTRNGTIRGVDLDGTVRSIADALSHLSGAQIPAVTGASKKTVFSQLTGSYTIRNGILFNNDLSTHSSLFRASGRGSANLMQGTLDYHLGVIPSLAPNIQIGGVPVSQLTIPIRVTGPWSNPSYHPDVAAIVRELAKHGVLKGLGSQIPGGNLGKGLGGLLQNLPGGKSAPRPDSFLKQLLPR